MMKLCNMSKDEKRKLSEKVLSYAHSEFNLQDTVDLWHDSLLKTLDTWKERRDNWKVTSI